MDTADSPVFAAESAQPERQAAWPLRQDVLLSAVAEGHQSPENATGGFEYPLDDAVGLTTQDVGFEEPEFGQDKRWSYEGGSQFRTNEMSQSETHLGQSETMEDRGAGEYGEDQPGPTALSGTFDENTQPTMVGGNAKSDTSPQGQIDQTQARVRVAELIELWNVATALNEGIRRIVVQVIDQRSKASVVPSPTATPPVRPLKELTSFMSAFDEPDEAEGLDQSSAEDIEEEEETVADKAKLQTTQPDTRVAARTEAKPEIILVAGVNYPKFTKDSPSKRVRSLSAGPWRDYCLKVAEERLKANPALNVTLFDFLRGTRERVTLHARRQAITSVEQQFAAPIADDYWNLLGIDMTNPTPLQAMNATLAPANKASLSEAGQVSYFENATALFQGKTVKLWDYVAEASKIAPKVLSIADVYAYIEGFARSGKQGALRELHFFAHAFNVLLNRYSGGPILINSVDDPRRTDRHPLDKDARAAKDFTKSTMDPAAFAQAFSASAQSFVWGCNFQRGFIRQFVYQISRHRRTLAAGKPMKISYTMDWGNEGEFRVRLGLSNTASVKNVSVDLAMIDNVLRHTNDATYMKKLATASGCPVIGAPPGTYADYDSGGSPLKLMHIPMTKDPFRDADDSFEHALLYFRDHLKFRFDTSFGDHNGLGRGYIVYDP